jgi:hypothetical protein
VDLLVLVIAIIANGVAILVAVRGVVYITVAVVVYLVAKLNCIRSDKGVFIIAIVADSEAVEVRIHRVIYYSVAVIVLFVAQLFSSGVNLIVCVLAVTIAGVNAVTVTIGNVIGGTGAVVIYEVAYLLGAWIDCRVKVIAIWWRGAT